MRFGRVSGLVKFSRSTVKINLGFAEMILHFDGLFGSDKLLKRQEVNSVC